MQIKHIQEEGKCRFLALENEEELGFLSYFPKEENKIVIDHTVVNPNARGKGVAQLLVNAAVAMAREKGLKIVAQCSYVARLFEKDKQFADIIAPF